MKPIDTVLRQEKLLCVILRETHGIDAEGRSQRLCARRVVIVTTAEKLVADIRYQFVDIMRVARRQGAGRHGRGDNVCVWREGCAAVLLRAFRMSDICVAINAAGVVHLRHGSGVLSLLRPS